MAKKIQRSFYLETDVFNYIKTYQEEYDLSSISVALERIIFSIMLGNNIQIKSKENAIEKSQWHTEVVLKLLLQSPLSMPCQCLILDWQITSL